MTAMIARAKPMITMKTETSPAAKRITAAATNPNERSKAPALITQM